MSVRTYLVIGVVFGAIVFLIAQFAGGSIANWLRDVQVDATLRDLEGVGRAITEPAIFVMENPIAGAILSVLFWPLLLIWILVILALLVIVAAVDVAEDVDARTSLIVAMVRGGP